MIHIKNKTKHKGKTKGLSNKLALKTTMTQVLEIYFQVCQPLFTEVASCAHLNREHFSLCTLTKPEGLDVSSTMCLQRIVKQIQDNFKWVSKTEAGVDLQWAMSLLQDEIAM
jgi:hypothetical protein